MSAPTASSSSTQPLYDPQRDIFIAPYPLLGLECCENGRHAISCGGGGAAGKKEIPNEIHLHAIDYDHGTKSSRFTTLDRLNMGKVLPTKVTYSPQQDLWCVSAGPRGYIIEIVGDGGAEKMNIVHEFVSETKPVANPYTQKEDPGCQELMILTEQYVLTAGTDGVAKVWSYPEWRDTPLVEFGGHTKQIEAMDVSPDEKLVATVSEDRSCRVWSLETGEERCSIVWMEEGVQPPTPMTLKFPHFLTHDCVLLSAAGPRGPATIGIWRCEEGKPANVVIRVNTDPKPCSALRLNQSKTMMMCGFVQGHKNLYSIDVEAFQTGVMPFKKLQMCGSAKKPIHQLAVQCVAFSGPETAVSASGDYTVHLGPRSLGKGKAGKLRGGSADLLSSSSSSSVCGCCTVVLLLLVLLASLAGAFVKTVNEMSAADIVHLSHWVDEHAVQRQAEMDALVASEFGSVLEQKTDHARPPPKKRVAAAGAGAARRRPPPSSGGGRGGGTTNVAAAGVAGGAAAPASVEGAQGGAEQDYEEYEEDEAGGTTGNRDHHTEL